MCVCVCEGGLHSQRGEVCVCVWVWGRLQPTTSTFPLPTHLLHKLCVRRGLGEEEEESVRRGERRSFFLASSSSPTHLLHKRCVWGSLPTTKRWREGACYELAITDTEPLNSRRHRIIIKRWVTHLAPFVLFRGDPALCVCVGGWNTTHVRSHSQESPILFYSRVSADEGDDEGRREVEPFPASSPLHKERWVKNSSTFGAAPGRYGYDEQQGDNYN